MATGPPPEVTRASLGKQLGLGFNVILLGGVSFFTDISSEIIFPLLPLYIIFAEHGGLGIGAGIGLLIVGAMEGLREATASLLKVFSGHLSDKIGRRKVFVVAGYSTSGLLKLAFPFLRSWEAVVGVAIAERVGKGLRDAPRDAILAESAPAEVRGKVFGFHRMADTTGATMGPVVALLLFAPLGFQGIFLVATIPALISVLLVFFVREQKRVAARATPLRVSIRELSPKLRFFILVATVFTLGEFSIFFLMVQVVLGETGAQADAFTLAAQAALGLYLVFNITYAAMAIPAGHISDRVGRATPILTGYSIFGLASLGFIIVPGGGLLLAPLFVMFGLAYALVQGVQRAFVADLSPPHMRATSLGTYHTAVGLARFPASFLFGALWALWGSGAAFGYAAAMSAAAAVLLLLMMRRYPRSAGATGATSGTPAAQ